MATALPKDQAPPSSINQEAGSRHPRALYLICVVEMFERLAAGALLPLFALYLHEHHGYGEGDAIALCGSFLAGTYLASVPAGHLADQCLGVGRALLLGLGLLTLGYGALALNRPVLLWPALCLLTLGMGFFRTGITASIGRLYKPSDPRRDAGFSLFYLAINVGYLLGPLIAEWIRGRWAWSGVCLLSMLATTSSLAVFAVARHSIEVATPLSIQSSGEVLPPQLERQRLCALMLLCSLAVVFFMVFQQTGGTLALFAQDHTVARLSVRRWSVEIRPGHYAILHGLLVLLFLSPLHRLLARLRACRAAPGTPAKLAWGLLFTAAAFLLLSTAGLCCGDTGRVSPLWLVGFYVLFAVGELLLSPIGLSLVTRLASPQRAARMVGWWYASVAVGYWLAGWLGWLWPFWPHHRYFALIAVLLLGATAVLLSRLRSLDAALPGVHSPSSS